MPRTVIGLAVLALITTSTVMPMASVTPAIALPISDSMMIADEPIHTNLFVGAGTGADDDAANPCTAIDAPCETVGGAVARALTVIADGVGDVTVNIAAGTYNENVNIDTSGSVHSLSLIGADAETTIIQGLGTALTPASVVAITSGTVNIAGLTITDGYSDSGGGIYNYLGELTISDSVVVGNTADGLSTGGGGGIYNFGGTVNVSDSVVSENNAIKGHGGGIFNKTGTLVVSDSTLSKNAGYYAGGILNQGILEISSSTLLENTATTQNGGGIYNDKGTLTITDSTLSGNSATKNKGGGIHNKGDATLTNSTLSGNSASQGGGIYTQNKLMTVSSSTFSDNTDTSNGYGGGIYISGSPGLKISNSILSESNCSQTNMLVDGGYNVSDEDCFLVNNPTSIERSTTIALSPLAENGVTGPWTMAIGPDSSAHQLVPTCTGTDERGMPRPGLGATANCDAGAYELQPLHPTVVTNPEHQTVVIGSDATFTAAASGAPTPTVTWQVNTGDGFLTIPDETKTSLTISNVKHVMNGFQYRAVFTNGAAPDATTAAATLTVPLGLLDHLVVSPASESMIVGGSQAFTAEGFDAHDNSLGDVTGATTFTGSAGLECTAASCTSTVAGRYTVTGTNGDATGTATLTVTAILEVDLPDSEPSVSEALFGVPTVSYPGEQFTATAHGFAPYAPVKFGIYSTVVELSHVTAGGNGTAVAQLKIPAGFTGSHTVVAAGMDPSLTPTYRTAKVNVVSAADAQLVATGADATPIQLGAILVVLGALFAFAAFRRRHHHSM